MRFLQDVGECLYPLLAERPYVGLDDWADIKRSSKKPETPKLKT